MGIRALRVIQLVWMYGPVGWGRGLGRQCSGEVAFQL